MSAVRVLNPVILTEFCKMRASPTAVTRRVKRDLFGPVNPVETTKIFTEELQKNQDKATKKWGFDFRAGAPLPTNSQYIWERVSFQESTFAPEMYTLTRAAHVRPPMAEPTALDLLIDERAERENCLDNGLPLDMDSCDDSQDESVVPIYKIPTMIECNKSSSLSSSSGSCRINEKTSGKSPSRKRQLRITEFMKERKRLPQTPKKSSPIKRMRFGSGSTSSGNTSSSSGYSIHAHSISTHFTLHRKK